MLALICAGFGVCAPTGFGDRFAYGQAVGGPLTQQQPGNPANRTAPNGVGDIPSPDRQEKLGDMRNAERQKRLVDDTNKLLELATQLKADVDKTNKNVLSIDVIKRADEIEKLAHAVKERMKG